MDFASEELAMRTERATSSVYCGLFLITLATLVFEILLTRMALTALAC